jgi:transcriptional regulator with XRE-family HTH domain
MSEKLGRLLTAACEKRGKKIGKDYTSYKLAQESQTTQSYAYRALHGKIIPGRDMLLKWCDALECSTDERAKIFHAAGYLSPEEMQKELEEDTIHAA